MSGIYVHIPFCKQKCTYCDFHFSTNLSGINALTKAISKEIGLRKTYLEAAPNTLYFGGGSPSILPDDQLPAIFDALHQNFDLTQLVEVTLESNPDDHTPEKLRFWKSLGINRLSIGIQSFIDRDLQLMNRAHNADEALRSVENAREAGFDSLSIDLIYGIPGQSFEEWQANVELALALNTDHLSAYCLTIEPKTLLADQLKKGRIREKDESDIEREYLFMHERLESSGMEHYEVSNFARSGKRALHNSNYWRGLPYLGIGPSAHSFDGTINRSWNVSNNARYVKEISDGKIPGEHEQLYEVERHNERLMVGLRTKEGYDFSELSTELRSELMEKSHQINEMNPATLIFEENRIVINAWHWLMSDYVIRALMF